MEIQIGRAILTTAHATSSYGMPVLVLDGMAYGPGDTLDGFPAGAVLVTTIAGMRREDLSADAEAAARKWLGQSAEHGRRWIQAIDAWRAAASAEYPDEGHVDYFRLDNTQGYTQQQLDDLNRRMAVAVAGRELDSDDLKYLSEQVLREYDEQA